MSMPLDPLSLPLWGSRLIEASAGTGKTWTIAALYLRLVLGEDSDDGERVARPLAPSQILVMTFTVAATRELSDRIRDRLIEAARCFRGTEPVAANDDFLRALIDRHSAGPVREQAAWRLAAAAEAMDDAAVFTIDAWVQRMLREHAFDSASLFDEELRVDEGAMLAEAARDYWRREVYPLGGAALDAVLAVWPGVDALTDDARVLMRHVEVDDSDVSTLLQVHDRSDAQRRTAMLAIKAGWIERFAAMRAWLNAQLDKSGAISGQKIQRKRANDWLDALARWASDDAVVDLGISDDAIRRFSPGGIAESVKTGHVVEIPVAFTAFAALAVALRTIVDPAEAMRLHAARRIKQRLRALKRQSGIHGFQDLQERLDEALRGPSGDRLRQRIVEQYPVALIDEFQDTSPLQYRMFDRLYRTADNARETALLLIGDPKQSIYGFRDADINSYLRARIATEGRHYLLTTNYRSTVALVESINRLFGAAETIGEGAFRFGVGDARPLPFVAVNARGRDERLVTRDGPVAALTICHDAELGTKDAGRHRFAERCAEQIVTSLNDERAGFVDTDDAFRRLRPADIAVLVRDRKDAAAIRRALQRRGVASAYLSDQESVFDSAEAADLLLWLRAVAEPRDSRRLRLAFATRLIGLAVAEMDAVVSDERVFERRADQLERLHDEWRGQGVLPMLRRTLHMLDLPARWMSQVNGERRLTNVLHLAELLQTASTRLDGEQALIRWLGDKLVTRGMRSDEEVVRLESDADLVKVITVHKAKGLEYPVVYLPFVCNVREPAKDQLVVLDDGTGVRRPVFRVDDEARRRFLLEAQQEDLRLLYVALTRAQHALWLGVAPLKVGNGKACVFHRSAFGYLLTGGVEVKEHDIGRLLEERFAGLPSVRLDAVDGPTSVTALSIAALPTLRRDPPAYAASFERDWAIGSFSALVRDLARMPLAAALVDPAAEEEVLSGPVDEPAVVVASNAARHRFPRGAHAGNFLHDQLEWLSEQRFALDDADVREQLVRRCERQGWGYRADDVVEWLGEVVATPLRPFDVALDALPRILPEMEFWFPSERVDARAIDRLCNDHLLDGRPRAALPERALRGMLMGFADLVLEVDGRYWVLDYKSNALGSHDGDYARDALEQSMADHRYDVQAAIYLLALHRLLRQRLGDRYDPERQLGGALYLFMRGVAGPEAGCYVMPVRAAFLEALDRMFGKGEGSLDV